MAYKCLFMDDDIYTAQDVNDALSNIVSGGICGYPFSANALADLNTAVAELVNGGTNYKGTDCLLVNAGGIYKISEGVCIMNDGTQIVFDADGYEITHEAGEYEYIYLERDVLHNGINVVVSRSAGGQDTIPIAEIKEDGTILDRRRFASAKVSLSAEPENIGVTKHISLGPLYPGESFDVDIGFNGWEYIIFAADRSLHCIELPDGSCITGFPTSNLTDDPTYRANVTRNGSVLHFEHNGADNKPIHYIDLEIEVR